MGVKITNYYDYQFESKKNEINEFYQQKSDEYVNEIDISSGFLGIITNYQNHFLRLLNLFKFVRGNKISTTSNNHLWNRH